MNLSFAGCGFLGIYHVGVACCFRKYAPHLLLDKIAGASAGAIAACCLLCDLPIGDMTSDILRVITEARSRSLGAFSPSFNIHKLLTENLEKFLPEDAHVRCSGKLHISLTRLYDGKNVVLSEFDTRDELIQALLASAYIPLFSGVLPPKYRGTRYMDGGCSDNLPLLDENTVTVSPFCGESDICPRDDSSQLFHINIANTSIELSKHNLYRALRILFPPKPEILSNMCKQGFDDALRFLHRNNLINCTRCLAVLSTFVVSETTEEEIVIDCDPRCQDCSLHREEALVSNVPDSVLSHFHEAIDKANGGLAGWLFKHRGIKLLSVLTLPYTVPADVVYATFAKLMVAAPQVGNGVWEISKVLVGKMSHLLNKVNCKRQQLGAKISCQLAITEYGRNKYDVESCQDVKAENKVNLNFTLNLDESDMPLTQSPARKFHTKEILQRKPSFKVNRNDTMDNDTFEHILQVTSQHETVMAYYYLDENNKVKVTEIFDVTDSDSPIVQTSQERDTNQHLEFDEEWDGSSWSAQQNVHDQTSEYELEDVIDTDAALFSDPESEWTGTFRVEEPEEDQFCHSSSDHRPESERLNDSSRQSNYQVPGFTFETNT